MDKLLLSKALYSNELAYSVNDTFVNSNVQIDNVNVRDVNNVVI
jgi:hypothetical protein